MGVKSLSPPTHPTYIFNQYFVQIHFLELFFMTDKTDCTEELNINIFIFFGGKARVYSSCNSIGKLANLQCHPSHNAVNIPFLTYSPMQHIPFFLYFI